MQSDLKTNIKTTQPTPMSSNVSKHAQKLEGASFLTRFPQCLVRHLLLPAREPQPLQNAAGGGDQRPARG